MNGVHIDRHCRPHPIFDESLFNSFVPQFGVFLRVHLFHFKEKIVESIACVSVLGCQILECQLIEVVNGAATHRLRKDPLNIFFGPSRSLRPLISIRNDISCYIIVEVFNFGIDGNRKRGKKRYADKEKEEKMFDSMISSHAK